MEEVVILLTIPTLTCGCGVLADHDHLDMDAVVVLPDDTHLGVEEVVVCGPAWLQIPWCGVGSGWSWLLGLEEVVFLADYTHLDIDEVRPLADYTHHDMEEAALAECRYLDMEKVVVGLI
jgi:hypothetical protein